MIISTKAMMVPLALFLLFFCFSVFAEQQDDRYEEYITEKINGLIVPAKEAGKNYLRNYDETTAEGYFTPSKDDIDKAVNRLPGFLGSSNMPDIQLILGKDFRASYKTRFVGVICGKQNKIWMVFGSPFKNAKWDGAWFTVLYDIKSGLFSHLEIHGGA